MPTPTSTTPARGASANKCKGLTGGQTGRLAHDVSHPSITYQGFAVKCSGLGLGGVVCVGEEGGGGGVGGGGTKMALTRVASTGTTGNSERPPLTASPASPATSLVPGDCNPHPPRGSTNQVNPPSVQEVGGSTDSRTVTLALQAAIV